jgi:hypothetical protein
MEHLDGPTLATVIARDGGLGQARAIAIATQIARGLSHAHERGIVHRDLKPGNVMLVAEDDESDVVRLLDFGIARVGAASQLTRAGTVMGTPQYMAPELFNGDEADARADLYALGVMLFELVTGDVPFEAGSLGAFANMHKNEPVPAMLAKARGPSCSPELEAIARRLLAKAPDDRYPSARAVIDALRAVGASGVAQTKTVNVALPVIGFPATERIHRAIQRGAPAYNAGDHDACFATYRHAAEELVNAGLRLDTRIAAAARLSVAIARADRADSPTAAAWDLRYAFDDLLHAGGLRGGDALESELTAAALIAAPRYAAGDLDLVGEFYLTFARWLAHSLREKGGSAAVFATLEQGLALADATRGGRFALGPVSHVLDALRAGVRATTPPLPSVTGRIGDIFTGADAIVERIIAAIAQGAPAFNQGNVEGCYRIYRQTAESVLFDAAQAPGGAEVAELMRTALAASEALEASQAAWVLRHAFDSLIKTESASGTLVSPRGRA